MPNRKPLRLPNPNFLGLNILKTQALCKMSAFHLTVSLLACICGALAVHYDELEMMGFQNCPQRNHCEQIANTPFVERICECDQACSTYDDCCLNARSVRFRQPTKEICLQYSNLVYEGAYAVANCPANYTGPSEIRVQCMSRNITDPFLNSPVTDSRTGKTFKNRYCALCNDANFANLQSWNIAVSCENSVSGDFAFQNLTSRSDLLRWFLNRQSRFDNCTIKYDKPAYINVRQCRANLVSTCPAGYKHQNYIRYCEAYMSVVVGRDVMYRNPHCALCNGVPIDEVSCFSAVLMSRKSKKPFSFASLPWPSFAMLLDVNQTLVPNACPSGQKYDPFYKKCRTLVCAIPGFKMQNGRCVKQKKN